ncbi:hypothetical protein ACFFGH_28445 [Lysobacter korlensis]|uniref:Uncharacterized protein n=1 Tax=Lysobacter korlensis TaxID=553636 RepID=A0ABV6RXS2_9GAMM
MALIRDETNDPFTAEEVELVAELSSAMTFGIRTGPLAQPGVRAGAGRAGRPGGAHRERRQRVRAALRWRSQRLADLNGRPDFADPMNIVNALVGAARAWAAGLTALPQRSQARSAAAI